MSNQNNKPHIAIGIMLLSVAMIYSVYLFREEPSPSATFPADWFAMALPDEKPAQDALIGKPMPELALTDWRNSDPIKPEDLKGKVILLDFWGTFCAPCIAAFPENSALYAKYKPKGVEFLGICTNEGQENYDRVLATRKPEYPMARDADLKTMKAWAAMSYPLYTVVDRKGIVRAMGLKHEFLEPAIQKLLAE